VCYFYAYSPPPQERLWRAEAAVDAESAARTISARTLEGNGAILAARLEKAVACLEKERSERASEAAKVTWGEGHLFSTTQGCF